MREGDIAQFFEQRAELLGKRRRDYGDWPVYLNLVGKFQKILDPNEIMHPGTLFPPMFR
jgi:hypothetical protein